MSNVLRLDLNRAAKILINRQQELIVAWLRKFGQLQHTELEQEILEVVYEMNTYLLEVVRRGYYLNAGVFVSHMQMQAHFVDEIIPMYDKDVFRLYMHSNGALRNEWRSHTVKGVIPLSTRSDTQAMYARTQVPNEAFVKLTNIHS